MSSLSTETTGYVLPSAIDAEQAILGAIIIESEAITTALSIIKSADCFYMPHHQLIYSACISLWSENSQIDSITITEKLKQRGDLENSGGPQYIFRLCNLVGSSANIESHCFIVKQKWIQRSIILKSLDIGKSCHQDTCDPFELLDTAISGFNDLIMDIRSSANETWMGAVAEFTDNMKTAAQRTGDDKYIIGLHTGVYSLDRLTMGLCDTHLIIYAGRPGEGKTTLMLQSVRENAKRGVPVGVFSLEMSTQELVLKIISMESGLEITKLRQGTLTHQEWQHYEAIERQVRNWPIYVCDTPGISVSELKAITKGWYSKHKIRGCFVDYIQLMSVGDNGRINNREQEISYISRSLKALGKEIHAPVVALSQMSREIEKRPKNDKRPRNSDLRESGSIEQDANEIVFVFRPELHGIDMYEDGTSTKDVTEFIVTKSRLGKIGSTNAMFDGATSKFIDSNISYSSPSTAKNTYSDTPF